VIIEKLLSFGIGGFVVIMELSLAKDPLPDVKDVFNIVSKEESHRGLHPGFGSKVQLVAFVVKFNNFKGNDFKRGFNNANKGPNPNILTANVVLFDILVVLEYSVSLLYVHKLIRDSKLFVCFDEHKRYIHDLNMVKTMGTGNERFEAGRSHVSLSFTMVMEVFNLMIKRQIKKNLVFKYHWQCKKLKLTHLCFAEDVLLFCHGDSKSVATLKKVLDEFGSVSGLIPRNAKRKALEGFLALKQQIKER
ncbi:hypothetical protein Tco_0933955, partial [Tanacetum coccineum]